MQVANRTKLWPTQVHKIWLKMTYLNQSPYYSTQAKPQSHIMLKRGKGIRMKIKCLIIMTVINVPAKAGEMIAWVAITQPRSSQQLFWRSTRLPQGVLSEPGRLQSLKIEAKHLPSRKSRNSFPEIMRVRELDLCLATRTSLPMSSSRCRGRARKTLKLEISMDSY